MTQANMTAEQVKQAHRVSGRPKYRNQRTIVDGITFPSKKEANRWLELKLLLAAGKISNLRRQVRFDLVVNGVKVCAYDADATYTENGSQVVEDVKGGKATKTRLYRLKAKLMKAVHGITIREV